MPAEVLLACANHAPYLADRDRHEGRILEVGDPHRDIHAFLD